MKWPFIDGHAIPPEELEDHEPVEYCQCSPVPILDPDQVIWWRHNRLNSDLLEAAESIKAAESVLLHQNAELKGLKMKLFPYSGPKIYLPKKGSRPI